MATVATAVVTVATAVAAGATGAVVTGVVVELMSPEEVGCRYSTPTI